MRAIVSGLLSCWLLSGCQGCREERVSRTTEQPARPHDAGHQTTTVSGEQGCFSAMADGAPAAQAVFEGLRHAGNGESWHTLLMHVLRSHAQLGQATEREEMGFGFQHIVTYRGRTSWIGYDTEGGAAIFCSPDGALLQLLRDSYRRAHDDPSYLRQLIQKVPEAAWED